ncbi:MAG: DNA polymerase I [Sphaerochaetaceae bacterium]|nr:DNA polymerase I [Sphaerochaetaceae bacterium]
MDSLFSDKDYEEGKELQEKNEMPTIDMAFESEKKEVETQIDNVLDIIDVEETDRKEFYIIDGFGLIFRSYYGFITNPLFDKDGNNISAIYGFFNTLFMVIRKYNPNYLVVALDSKGPTFRHKMYEPYKANRDDAPQDLKAQIPVIIDLLEKINIPTIAKSELEADDIIAYLCEKAVDSGLNAIMFTADKDLLQLVNKYVYSLRPPKKGQKEYRLFGPSEVEEEFLIRPEQIIDYLSLIGDSSDNVPGVKGIGPKGAVNLLTKYKTLENIYDNLDKLSKGVKSKLTEGKESAFLSKSLVKLKIDETLFENFNVENFNLNNMTIENIIPFFEQKHSRSLVAAAKKLMNKEQLDDLNNKEEEEVVTDPEKIEAIADSSLLGASTLLAIDTIEELEQILQKVSYSTNLMAFDTETTSENPLLATLVGFSFSFEVKKAYYFPLICDGKRIHEEEPVRKVLKKYLEQNPIALIGHNIKYDYKVMKCFGVELTKIVFDTMIAAWLYESNEPSFKMDSISLKYLNYLCVSFKDVVPKGKLFSDVPKIEAVAYAAEDSDITFRLYKFFNTVLDKDRKKVLNEIELPLITILANMEVEGIGVSTQKLNELSTIFGKRIDKNLEEIYSLSGHEFNLNSTKQLQTVLFEEKKLPPKKKTKTGYSTATDVLESLIDEDPIIKKILDYRSINKLKSTYVDTFPSLVNPNTNRIHTSFLQFGTATGRLSSINPNLQNIPIRSEEGRKIRDAFVPKDGCILVSADYAQIELVVLAHVANDKALQQAFLSGQDVHKFTASLIFDKELDEITSDERRVAKTINFGVMYGMSAFRLAKELSIKRSDASDFIKAYFNRYSNVALFIDQTISKVRKEGKITTLMGHVRNIPKINSKNKLEKAASERVAVNSIIQGSAAEIMKIGMIRVAKALKENNLKSKLLLQVHDEVILEVPNEEEEIVRKLLKYNLENAYKLSIPLRTSIESGNSWGEMH